MYFKNPSCKTKGDFHFKESYTLKFSPDCSGNPLPLFQRERLQRKAGGMFQRRRMLLLQKNKNNQTKKTKPPPPASGTIAWAGWSFHRTANNTDVKHSAPNWASPITAIPSMMHWAGSAK